MSLRIVYGRAGSGKTTLVLNEMKSRLEKINSGAGLHHDMLVLLVPEQFSFQAEKKLVSVVGTGGILDAEVLSFQRMAYRIFNESGGITYPHIHPSGKAMIIYRILDKMKGQLKVFSKTAQKEGFVDTLSTLITEFKRYGVTPQMLLDASDNITEGKPLKEKLEELGAIYEEFDTTIDKRYRDSDDDLTMAAKKLAESSLYQGAEIWIDGFVNFTPQEYNMISQLLQKAKRVTICLCADQLDTSGRIIDTDVFAPVKNAYRRLVKIAEENKVAIEKPVIMNNPPVRFNHSPELTHLEKNYYRYPHEEYPLPTKDISLYSAMNAYSEIEAAAADIRRLCRDHNLRYRDIAVVARNLADYDKLIEVVFTQYEIPYYIDKKADINNHPLVRLILSAMDIFIENWSYESVFRYLKTGLTGIEEENLDVLENYVLACGIRGNKWTSKEDWDMSTSFIPDHKISEKEEELLTSVNDTRKRVIEPLLKFREKTKGKNTALEFCTRLYDLLLELQIPRKINERVDQFRTQGLLNMADQYSQVWDITMDVLDQTVEVMADETFGVERFSNILKIGLEKYQIGTIPAALDQVLVGSIDRSKNHEIKALYILGVNDGVFPSTSISEGVLSDQDRRILKDMKIELAGDTQAQAFDEQYLVYQSLTTAGEYLRISWPIGNSEGKTLRPSMIVPRLMKLFPKIKTESNIIISDDKEFDMELISAKKPSFNKMINAFRLRIDKDIFHPIWEDVYAWFYSQDGWREYCERVKKALVQKNEAEKISEEKIKLLYGNPIKSSVSKLEKYSSCPYAFFIQYGLGAKERKIYRMSAPDTGTFMHAIIEEFSKRVSQGDVTWRSFDKEWCKNEVSKIVDAILTSMNGAGMASSRRYTMLALRLKRVVTRSIWLIAQHIRASSFDPIEYEVGFGAGEKYSPIVLHLDENNRIELQGRIDRVDCFETDDMTYLSIIDYKSGAKDFKLSDVYYGLQIQLITYMDAIWENEEQNGKGTVLPAGMLYFKVDDPLIKEDRSLTPEQIEAAIMKSLKMKGLLMADVKVIKAMDNTIDGSSKIIPASINKSGEIGAYTSGATEKQLKLLRKYIRGLLKKIGSEIASGNVDIKPYRKKSLTACTYCSFHSVCQFDTSRKENSYKLLLDKTNQEVWERLEEEKYE